MGVGTGALITLSEGADVPLLHAGEVLVQLRVKILAVAVPQGDAHAEVDDDLHPRIKAVVQQAPEVFLRVIDEGQNGAQPHAGVDAVFPHGPQYLEALPGGADIGLQQLT